MPPEPGEPAGNGLCGWLVVACIDCEFQTARRLRRLPLCPDQVERFARAHRGHKLRALSSPLGFWFDVSDLGRP